MAAKTAAKTRFHEWMDEYSTRCGQATPKYDTKFTYKFENFFHPFVGKLIEKLNTESLPGMLDPTFHDELSTEVDNPPESDTFFEYFKDFYEKTGDRLVAVEGSPKQIDLSEDGPYANYNWELLFHVPFTIAVHLSKNQRFAEAQKWFHYIFDPTCNDTSKEPPQRFWKFLPFRYNNDITQIDQLLALLDTPDDECSDDDARLKDMIVRGYDAIRKNPFQPHAVARTRHFAYQYCVVMKYLDNLIAWGDSLFRQDTIESINEATQRYVLAANLLGARPQRIPRRGSSASKTFAQLQEAGLDKMQSAMVEMEGEFPFNLGPSKTNGTGPDSTEALFGIGPTPYFCIPRNEKLLGYWDTVADRLFKIRHGMSIEGVVRQLALFEPEIDPGMMVKAAAAGIDIASIVSGLNQPIGPARSLLLIQKSLELCSEVRSLGSALLSAIEKGDGERMALLRQEHEVKIQEMAKEVRFLQHKQAQESTESLLRSRSSTLERYRYYQRLLGLTPDSDTAPDTLPLDRRELTEENFDEAYDKLVGKYEKDIAVQTHPKLKLAGDTSPANQSGASGKGSLYLNVNEDAELNEHLPNANQYQTYAFVSRQIAPVFSLIPDAEIDIHFWGLGGTIVFGGSALTKNVQTLADILDLMASRERHDANTASRTGSYERRADDWMLQSNLAARELMQIGRQMIGSLIGEQVARHEYDNIQKQIDLSKEVDQFLGAKFTNEELYLWMQGEISRLYYEYYRFAFDMARRAEQTMKQELMRPEVDTTDFVKFNYWDGGRKGLLSGETLYLDVKRMEMAYHDNNKREYELTKHVSLRRLNPMALLALKATGTCEVTVPEWLFDLDCPGHYMRRIKSVSLSIPSVAGPYTNVNCTLSLLKSSLRTSSLLEDDQYARQDSQDTRFRDYPSAVQSIVTSSGNNDSGMFETNLRDERFLPFEGFGAESTWRLELPAAFRQFDYDTIADVVFHIRYTARQGGTQLRDKAAAHLERLAGEEKTPGLALLLSLTHDFPNEWHDFVSGDSSFAANVKREHFPYFTQGKTITIDAIHVYATQAGSVVPGKPTEPNTEALTEKLNDEGWFELSLASDGRALVREKQARVFAVIKYSMESV